MIKSDPESRKVSLNLELTLKPGQLKEEFYYFLAYAFEYFIEKKGVEKFKEDYLKKNEADLS